MDNRPIGIFDSGVGGLTVMREVMEQLPYENLIYFGDTARIPYGSRSVQTIKKYAYQCASLLKSKDVKTIVIACNTASSIALEHLQKNFDIPIIGVIEPGARSAAAATKNSRIGVIGTVAAINSGAYQAKIMEYRHNSEVIGIPCPLFVPIIEEGWEYSTVAELTAEKYLGELIEHDVDTLVLGCTHYPILRYTIKKVIGPSVKLVNPAFETARDLKKVLADQNLLNENYDLPQYEYYVSDAPERFRRVGGNFLKKEINNLSEIAIDNL
ncbi:glutamate racemase [Sedimentibacter acidaminivorans]|uniref:Glutamate racemase n=1 Tax=Sedimentibacter acidaminivorans TaxID=913099 RepID=A0ABS4GF80_9FIRM|nr:glutamate racemase [Sedimentibacter acidaminivorans]MBP1926351.1 glutamate racemase [Sedimentibacter acidaminivorans]